MVKANTASQSQHFAEEEKGEPIVFRTIEEILKKEPDSSGLLVGDYQIMKGAVCVIAGPAGCGKSTIAFDLAVAGVTESDWMGLKVHRPFKTLIVQTENGAIRLYRDAKSLRDSGEPIEFGDKIRISNPPEFGSDFGNKVFCKVIKREMERVGQEPLADRGTGGLSEEEKSKGPDLVILDPWNNFCDGDSRESTILAIKAMRRVFGSGENAPAIVVVAHSRKGSGNSGQKEVEPHDLLNEISGSLTLGAHARSAFFVRPSRKEGAECRIEWTCIKNNNGVFGKPVYFQRKEGSAENGRFVLDVDQKPSSGASGKPKGRKHKARSSNEKLASVLRAVSDAGTAGVPRSDLLAVTAAKFGITEKSVTNQISECLKKEYLSQQGNNIVEGKCFELGLKACGIETESTESDEDPGMN